MSNSSSLIGDARINSLLDIVCNIRMYELSLKKGVATSENDFRGIRKSEFDSMVYWFKSLAEDSVSEDGLWDKLRDLNITASADVFSNTSEPTLAPSPQDDYARQTLSNCLNMLSWYKFDSTLKLKVSTSHHEEEEEEKDYTWNLMSKVKELFDVALKDFPPGRNWWMKNWERKDTENGHFHCDTVLSIWPQLRNSNKQFRRIKRPIHVGEKIKNRLVEQRSPMIQGEPVVYGVGFVSFKLSGNWMAEHVHMMLRDGINTWAPKHLDPKCKTLFNSTSWDESNLTPLDLLRRQLLIMSQMHMTEFAKSTAVATTSSGMALPPGKLEEHFSIAEENGHMLIYSKDKRNTKPLVRGKFRKKGGKNLGGSLGYPSEDLGAIWHGLVHEKADWISCLTPTQQQDYIRGCGEAAKHAGWITGKSGPRIVYVGFKTSNTSMRDLLCFLNKAQYPSEAGEAAKLLGYTKESVLDCALTFTILKNHRLADCKFSYDEMLDIQGNTFINLLTTQAQVHKITDHYRKDIEELKKVPQLGLEKGRIIWSEGVERVLGLHLLMFTDMIVNSYYPLFPHYICEYLIKLSEKFSRFYETYASSGFEEPSLPAVSAAMVLSYVNCSVPNPVEPLILRSRFELFTAHLHITKYPNFVDGTVFGFIIVSDNHDLLPEGWDRKTGFVTLLDYDMNESVKMKNAGRLKIGNPRSRHSVPLYSKMEMTVLLYAATEEGDEFYEVCNVKTPLKVTFQNSENSCCEYLVCEGDDGYVQLNYILLRDAVDANIKVKLGGGAGQKIRGKIMAHYGDDFKFADDEEMAVNFYTASLFESESKAEEVDADGYLPLARSILAVPNKGSLVIIARLRDCASGVEYDGFCKVSSLPKGTSTEVIVGKYPLQVEITWSRD